MNINFEYYKIFYTVAKNKNITKAANELLISQPAISKSIKNLESWMNCTLFVRNKFGVSLTEEGIALYNEIKNAIEIIENAEHKIDEMVNLDSGCLNIGISNTLTQKYLLPYIKEFTEKYPKIKIKIHTGTSQDYINKARNGLIDFIIINLPFNLPSDFEKKELLEIHDCFVASNTFEELKNKKIKIEDLNNYPLVLLAKGSNGRFFLDDYCTKHNINLNPKFELASYSLLSEFIKSGIGIGLVTKEFVKNELKNNELFEIQIDEKLDNRHIGIIYLKNKTLNRCSKEFIKLLENKKILD